MNDTNPKIEKLIPASRVKEMFGGISDMTLWRWLNEAEIGFPQPIRINGRRYWRIQELLSWLNSWRERTCSTSERFPSDRADICLIDSAIDALREDIDALREDGG